MTEPTLTHDPRRPQDYATPVELMAAIHDELDRDFREQANPPIPTRVYTLLRRALRRANAGEFL